MAGVADAIDDMPEPDGDAFRAKHELGAWEAYNSGYQAGLLWRGREQEWPR